MNKRIRIVMAKPGLDGHDRGIKILAKAPHLYQPNKSWRYSVSMDV